jgi:hypothetical protein
MADFDITSAELAGLDIKGQAIFYCKHFLFGEYLVRSKGK